MFTGIIDHCAEITDIASLSDRATLWIKTQFTGLALGESIAVDGACLTVTDIQNNLFACEVSPETMQLTVACHYKKNQSVNVERALCVNDRLGGHLVSGHVDHTLIVKKMQAFDEFTEVSFDGVQSAHQAYLIQKGSVTINGVSLTVNQVFTNGFNVMLIPHTQEQTNLSELQVDQSVNVEFDTVAKLIAKQLEPYLSAISKEGVR